MYKALLISSDFGLNILAETKLFHFHRMVRPNYFIFMGYLKTGGGEGVRAKLLNTLWIRHCL